MDQKHREYCIRLGNPFMKDDNYKEPFQQQLSNNWIDETNMNTEDDNWLNNSKKFTD